MDTPSAHDEGEPAASANKFHSAFIFFSLLLLCFTSCKEAKKEIKKEPPVTDSMEIKRKQLQPKDTVAKVVTPKKKIYLTFDDGPNEGTMHVLDAVEEDSVPVSFFIVGKHVFDSPAQALIWQQLKADSTIELCNHSYTHALNHYTKYYKNPAGVVKDIERNKEKLGFHTNITRMPGRNAWRIGSIRLTDIKESIAAIDSVHKAGFDIMGWDVEWMFDHKTLALVTDTAQLLRQIENKLASGKTRTPGHLVLLAHDQSFNSESAVEKLHYVFRQLKNNPEYELVLAETYPGVSSR